MDSTVFTKGVFKGKTYRDVRMNNIDFVLRLFSQEAGVVHDYFDFMEYCIKVLQSDSKCICHLNKERNINKNEILHDNKETNIIIEPDYYVYTDGSCKNNGKENAIAGIGIYFGENDPRNVSEQIKFGKQTNNVAELKALIMTYYIIREDIFKDIHIGIVSDSKYAIGCATTYGESCEKKGWKDKIPNKELVREAYNLYKNVNNVTFMYVKAHTKNNDKHSIGNREADLLARLACDI